MSARQARQYETASSMTYNKSLNVVWAATVFLSAFLLFLVQPMICKVVLPWFGGAPAVWTTAVFFFQAMLLLGYLYAHFLSRYFTPRWQAIIHVAVVIGAVVLLPITPDEAWKPSGEELSPAYRVLGLLTDAIGLQFFLLSTTSPLLQAWWFRIFRGAPYQLYAVSNAGSFLALFSYPFLIEPQLGARSQAWGWSIGFFAVAICLGACSLCFFQSPKRSATEQTSALSHTPGWWNNLAWLGLSAIGSVLLLAMTSHLTQNVAVVPFLWVAPLALYLLSFILCFAEPSLYRRSFFGGVMILGQIAVAFLYSHSLLNSVVLLLLIHLVAMFAGCMVCHGELARLKPAPEYLTHFFVSVSLGGALGGFFVSFVAPNLFSTYLEFPFVLIACWGALVLALYRDKTSWMCGGHPRWAWGIVIGCVFALLFCLRNGIISDWATSVISRRTFFGVLSVRPMIQDGENYIQLRHGAISHGAQHLDDTRKTEPTYYYGRKTGIGFVLQLANEKPNNRVGLLGLGVGTLAAYSRANDYYRAYEINGDVVEIATDPNIFTYWGLLKERGAKGDIVLGDARLSLSNELNSGQKQEFDVLVLDVFSGDAIPTHLLTIEAFEVYLQHLADDGMLAVHTSNRHLDLIPVVISAAKHFERPVALIAQPKAEWIVLGPADVLKQLQQLAPEEIQLLQPTGSPQLWTDDFSNIFRVLK